MQMLYLQGSDAFSIQSNRGVSETWECPALLITSNHGTWDWLTSICQEDLSYDSWGIFCYTISCLFFFLTLWKVIRWLKCKRSFADNCSSYVVNVILLLKGFLLHALCQWVSFSLETRNYHITSAWPGLLSCSRGDCGPAPGYGRSRA